MNLPDHPPFKTMVEEIMAAQGLTTYRLAELLGCSQATVWRIWAGDSLTPHLDTADKIRAMYNDLQGDDDKCSPQN